MLQWVHGPITVVMAAHGAATEVAQKLQWVHGPITVVMVQPGMPQIVQGCRASMGPRSDNRGYGRAYQPSSRRAVMLQWVHGPITVVMAR